MPFSDECIDLLIKKLDLNGDGVIDFRYIKHVIYMFTLTNSPLFANLITVKPALVVISY